MNQTRPKILLKIIIAGALLTFQLRLTLALTERTLLALPVCVLVSSIPFAVYVILVALLSSLPPKTKPFSQYRDFIITFVRGFKHNSTMRGLILSTLVLAAVLLVLFHQSLFSGKGLVPADGIYQFAPWNNTVGRPVSNWLLQDQFLDFIPRHHLFYTDMHRGKLSLWNPYLCCGIPALASIQTAALSPLNLIFSFM